MAITHIQGQGAADGSGTVFSSFSAAFPASVGSGDVVCGLFGHGAGTLSSVTDDKGNSYTIIGQGTIGGGTIGAFYLAGIINGPRTITMSGSGLQYPSLIIDDFSGVGALLDTDAHTTTTSNSSTLPSGNVMPAQNGELLYAAGWATNSSSISIGSPWTSLESAGAFHNELSAWQVQAAAGSIGASFIPSNGNDTGFAAILAFAPAGIAVQGDAFVVTEAETAAQVDRGAQIEFLGTNSITGNILAAAESLSGQHVDPGAPAEWLAWLHEDARDPLESAVGAAPADTPVACEALGSQRHDAVAWSQAQTTANAGNGWPLDWKGALAVITEAFCPLTTAGQLRGDLSALLETNASAAISVGRDSSSILEILGSALRDNGTILELLLNAGAAVDFPAGYLAKAAIMLGLPTETLGQAITVLEAFLVVEASSHSGADAALAAEAPLAVRDDCIGATELWTTPLPRIAPGRLLASPGRRRLLAGSISE